MRNGDFFASHLFAFLPSMSDTELVPLKSIHPNGMKIIQPKVARHELPWVAVNPIHQPRMGWINSAHPRIFIQPFSGLIRGNGSFPSLVAGASTLGWMIQSRRDCQRSDKLFCLSFPWSERCQRSTAERGQTVTSAYFVLEATTFCVEMILNTASNSHSVRRKLSVSNGANVRFVPL